MGAFGLVKARQVFENPNGGVGLGGPGQVTTVASKVPTDGSKYLIDSAKGRLFGGASEAKK